MVYTISVYIRIFRNWTKMEAGDFPPLNMNAVQNISVKTVLNILSYKSLEVPFQT